MSLSYAQQNAYQVLLVLTTSGGSLLDRIERAFAPGFTSLAHEAEDQTTGLQPGLVHDIVALRDEMTSARALASDGQLRATLDNLSGPGVVAIADRMVSLCIESLQAHGDAAWRLEHVRNDEEPPTLKS